MYLPLQLGTLFLLCDKLEVLWAFTWEQDLSTLNSFHSLQCKYRLCPYTSTYLKQHIEFPIALLLLPMTTILHVLRIL